ncbi:hypothetical protein COS64_03490 [archaeon CG06_land_8_20_14_3_00_37_11]|nr:MAG: hypothetical protein COS64_03490 [archaeon CG06_land_8_20_14_3_00_37_11]
MFRVIQCRNCGLIQVTSADKGFKCKQCGKNCIITGCRVYSNHDNADDARIHCVEQRKKLF